MWIIDCPIRQGQDAVKSYPILIRQNPYIFGSSKNNKAVLDLPMISESLISRKQTEFKIDAETGWLLAKNVGARSIKIRMASDELDETIAGRGKHFSVTLKTNSIIYKDDANNNFTLVATHLPIGKIYISSELSNELGFKRMMELGFEIYDKLKSDEVKVDDKTFRLKNNSKWLSTLKEEKWKTAGDLAAYYIPKDDDIEVSSAQSQNDTSNSTDFSDNELLSRPKDSRLNSTFHMNYDDALGDNCISDRMDVDEPSFQPPPFSQLIEANSIESKENSREESLLSKIMAEAEEDNSFIKSQSQRKRKRTKNKAKALDLANPTMEVVPEIKEKVVPAKEAVTSSNSSSNTPFVNLVKPSLVDQLLKAREMKKDKSKYESDLIEIGMKSKIKVAKFKFNLAQVPNSSILVQNDNYSKPEWSNRMNFSNFRKADLKDNPVMDSTIKYIKMKVSKYKSDEMQVDLDRHDYILDSGSNEAFDKEFGSSEGRGGGYAKKRLRGRSKEAGLFVDSESDGSDEEVRFKAINTKKDTEVSKRRNVADGASRTSTPRKSAMSILSNMNEDDEDDLPIFKAQKKY